MYKRQFPNGEFRTSICNCTPKKTGPKRIFSATLHVAVFNENNTDRKLTPSPSDPFQSRQKRCGRDLNTKITNQCFSQFFNGSFCVSVVFWLCLSRINGKGRTDIEKTRTDIEKTRADIEKRGRTLKNTRSDGRTDGRTDARNFVHRGRRVFFRR